MTQSERALPIVAVDIDGVINHLGPALPGSRIGNVQGFRIQVSPTALEAMKRVEMMRVAGMVQPVWATAWGHDAALLSDALLDGMGASWDVVDVNRAHPDWSHEERSHASQKAPWLLEWADGQRLFWWDDTFEAEDFNLMKLHPHMVMNRVLATRGLIGTNLVALNAWATGHKDRSDR